MTQTVSTINPSAPSQGSSLASLPVQANFLAAYNDINYLLTNLGSIGGTGRLRFAVKGINFNAIGDTPIVITMPPGITRYRVAAVALSNASASITSSQVGVFTAVSGGGVTIAALQAPTVTASASDTANNSQNLTLADGTTTAFNDVTLYVRIGTAQGSAATCDVIFEIEPMT
jgi:hypothetical protein